MERVVRVRNCVRSVFTAVGKARGEVREPFVDVDGGHVDCAVDDDVAERNPR